MSESRCVARTMVPGSPLLATHPKNVYLRELAVLDALNEWIGVFAPEHRGATVDRLLASVGVTDVDSGAAARAKKNATKAKKKLRPSQEAISAGANPVALVDMINDSLAVAFRRAQVR